MGHCRAYLSLSLYIYMYIYIYIHTTCEKDCNQKRIIFTHMFNTFNFHQHIAIAFILRSKCHTPWLHYSPRSMIIHDPIGRFGSSKKPKVSSSCCTVGELIFSSNMAKVIASSPSALISLKTARIFDRCAWPGGHRGTFVGADFFGFHVT